MLLVIGFDGVEEVIAFVINNINCIIFRSVLIGFHIKIEIFQSFSALGAENFLRKSVGLGDVCCMWIISLCGVCRSF